MNTHADKTQENKSQSFADSVSQKQGGDEYTFQFVDNRPEAVAQQELQEIDNNSPQVSQLKAFQEMANNSPQAKQATQLQAMATTVIQRERTVTNSQAQNMRISLARVFGGAPEVYQIDQESGSTYEEGRGNVQHHGVKVTDTRHGSEYTCDFHRNGTYYTRG